GQILLKKMVKQAAGRLSIMPGGGISAANIGRIAATSQAREFHFTAKIKVSSAQATILPGLENGYWQSDEIRIRDTIAALNT
ncbi:MAG: copper homeostasis protein CutC, partial [Saprospiraceae bacterium]